MCKQSLLLLNTQRGFRLRSRMFWSTLIKGTLSRLRKKPFASWCPVPDHPQSFPTMFSFFLSFVSFKLCWLQTYNSYYLPSSPDSGQEVPKGKHLWPFCDIMKLCAYVILISIPCLHMYTFCEMIQRKPESGL